MIAALSQMSGTLVLNCIVDAREAACINAELANSTLTHLVYHGKWPIAAPTSLLSMELWHWPRDSTGIDSRLGRSRVTMSTMLARLQTLPLLESLTFGSYGWYMHPIELEWVLTCLPVLRSLHIELLLSPQCFLEFRHCFKPLADLAPGVQLTFKVHAFPLELSSLVGDEECPNLLHAKITHLELRCLHDTFPEDDQALLAQCSIQRLTVHYEDPDARLVHVSPGAIVEYHPDMDPNLASTAVRAEQFWNDPDTQFDERFESNSQQPMSPAWRDSGEDTDGSEWTGAEAEVASCSQES